jgi:hypothetical protein
MTASFGLRYETQNIISDIMNFAPRLGFAWGIGGHDGKAAKTIVRTGFGIFCDRVDANLVSNAERQNGTNTKQFVFPNPDFFPNIPTITSAVARPSALTISGGPREEHHNISLPTITQLDPNVKAPYTIQTSVAVERQLSKTSTLSVSYLYSRGVRQIFSRNINAVLPGTFDPNDPASGVRPLNELLNIFQFQSQGIYKQNQVITNFNMRGAKRLTVLARYVLNYASASADGVGSFPVNQFDPNADYGRAGFDVRHRVFVASIIDLPMRFRLSPFFILDSGSPYDITVGSDLNGDSIFNDRPTFATDLSRPSVVRTRLGNFDTDPIPGQTIVPRYFATGPVLYTLNLRLSKTFSFGEKGTGKTAAVATSASRWNPKYSLTFNVFGQNLLNHVNPGPPVGSLDSPLFGTSNTVAGAPYSVAAANRRINTELVFSF